MMYLFTEWEGISYVNQTDWKVTCKSMRYGKCDSLIVVKMTVLIANDI